ncbi:PREDICTED: acid-sensing ion channel 4-like [Amphimedon queenslandica]|uniref:Uncharacterized protein n=1 Tax=Amphimedon queenslandica TaxID=400682 RepID=A0A1X7UE35_AMPQE|nr:PREDICTED: acid-sensing ion channel 4-like [Amphimedon queenslandica]|eukprot:XP_011405345.1 PREDICTED: acid-sensing ion channel 4-like [Amphimedon queenslandica]
MTKKGFKWSDQYFNDFVETTTINGVFHIFRGRTKTRRLLWGLLFFISFVSCTIVLGFSFKRYSEKPTVSAINVILGENGIPFPSVTVCNQNFYKDLNVSNETNALIHHLFHSGGFLHDINRTQQCKIDEDRHDFELQDLLIPKENNFIHYCAFSHQAESEIMLCKDKFFPTLTPAGICYTFNGVRSKTRAPKMTTTGKRYGLRLILNIEQETHPVFDGVAGVQVIVHESNDIPRPNLHGVGVSPGQNVDIGVKRAIMFDETDQDECIKDNGKDLPFLPGVVYSQYACRQNELYESLADKNLCNCIIDPFELGNATCSSHDLCCLQQQFTEHDRNSSCRPPCKYTYYDIMNSYSSFPEGHALTEIKNSINASEDYIKKNFLSASVFLQALETRETTTRYSYGVVELLGELGGNLGLFLGISIISVMELLVLVIDEVKKCVCPKKVKQKFEKFDDKLKCIPDCVEQEEKDENTSGPSAELNKIA